MADVLFNDGVTARRQAVSLEIGTSLVMKADGVTIATWPFETLHPVDAPKGILRLTSDTAADLSRLEVRDAALIARLHQAAPELGRSAQRARRGQLRVAGWTIAACVSLVLLALYGIPALADRIVAVIPDSLERRFGRLVEPHIEGMLKSHSGGAFNRCEGGSAAAGEAAIERLVARMRKASAIETPVFVTVHNSKLANAFAIPGGHVYILSGLINRTKSSDAFVAVLAHELGHVSHRHGMQHLVRSTGFAFLVGLVLGDFSGGGSAIIAAQVLFDTTHSRDAEREADQFSAQTMAALGGNPGALAIFFQSIDRRERDQSIVNLFRSHPLTNERIADLKAQQQADRPPVLSDDDWQAIKAMCS